MSEKHTPGRRNHNKSETEETEGLINRLMREGITLEQAAEHNLLREKSEPEIRKLRIRISCYFKNAVLGKSGREEEIQPLSLGPLQKLLNILESFHVIGSAAGVKKAIGYSKNNMEVIERAFTAFSEVPVEFIRQHGHARIQKVSPANLAKSTTESIRRCIGMNDTEDYYTWEIVMSMLRVSVDYLRSQY